MAADAKKNEQTIERDVKLFKLINRHSVLSDYTSRSRKKITYPKGTGAVIAALIEVNNLTNEGIEHVMACSLKKIQAWRSGKETPELLDALILCLIFNLNMRNTKKFLEVFNYSLNPSIVCVQGEEVENRDYRIEAHIENYHSASAEEQNIEVAISTLRNIFYSR